MAEPVGTISGLASNVQWRDLIDQIIAQEQARMLTPITKQIDAAKASTTVWSNFQSLVNRLKDASSALRDNAFDSMQSFVGSGSTGRTLLTMTATGAATPGTYKTEIVSLARADKLGGSLFASAESPLWFSGDFYVNGARITIRADDSLSAIRDRINAANSGSNPTGVSASILTVGPNANRLVLTSSQLGASGIELSDSSAGVLRSLGLTDGTTQVATTANGGASSFRFRDSTTAVGTLLGGAMPAATSIAVGNTTINVDLATQSLDDIRAAIAAAGVNASLTTENFNGAPQSRLAVSAPVSAVPGNADSQRVVELLGFTRSGQGSVSQVVANSSSWSDASNTTATTSTALADLNVGGLPAGMAAGDSITIRGVRGDGAAFTTTMQIAGGETLQSLIDRLNDPSAFGGGARPATASLSGGTLRVSDSLGGDSQLSLSMVVNKAGGGTASLGQMMTETAGFSRQIVQGADAVVRIDGSLITRSTNTITDAIAGVTLNLVNAEAGTTIDVPVTRDTGAAVSAMQALVSTYNSVATFVRTQTAANGQMPFNVTMRSTLDSLKQSLLEGVPGLSGSFSRVSSVGLTFDKTGQLQLDSTVFKAALTSNLSDVKALFGKTVVADAGITYLSSSNTTRSGTFAVNITAPATVAKAAGSGFTGLYTASGDSDTISITDGETFVSGQVSLATGDDMETIVGKFNTLFTTKGMSLKAANVGGQLVISGATVGSAGKFNVFFDGGNSNPAAQLGIASGQFTGTDVAGTIDGVAAVGSGQRLTGAQGSSAEGLTVEYTGAAPFAGQVVHNLGIGALLTRAADILARSGDGTIENQKTSLSNRVDSLTERSINVQDRLERHRQALLAQFTKMERAMSILQAQQLALSNQIKGLQSSRG